MTDPLVRKDRPEKRVSFERGPRSARRLLKNYDRLTAGRAGTWRVSNFSRHYKSLGLEPTYAKLLSSTKELIQLNCFQEDLSSVDKI
jgi:hypothetical protein